MNEDFDPAVYPAPAAESSAVQDPAPMTGSAAEVPSVASIPDIPPIPEAPELPEIPAASPYQARPASVPSAEPVYQDPAPAQPVYPYTPAEPPRTPQEPRPARKSPYAPMTSIGMAIQLFLMNIPVIGLILSIIWACGVCRKIARRNLARAWLILLILGILLIVALAVVARFCFTEEITRIFEQVFPGYTIKWG